ncbi:hypothetical protein MY4038_008927 [Beauveria bassiana]|uniref:Chaperone protein DnaJ n=1 Tax=Beauveria bassiana TaxID=176275 RepID=A0A2N6NW04_BEABA|nr:Chaperone protein DnaJ [Beauveria bassiana]
MSQFLSIVGWAFLPGIATSWIQTIYYGLTIRAGDPKPAPGSARHTSHRNTIHILVVASYLLYTIFEANYDLRSAPSFYTELGIPVTAADRDIKSRFRRLAALHHPDKLGPGGDADASSAFFMHLKTASDTLQDAAKRYAYERFGPAMLAWPRCVTVRDFVTHGVVYNVLPYYGLAAATIYAFGLVGYMDFAKFYRWLLLVALCLLEVTVATRPAFPAPLRALNAVLGRVAGLPPYLPFELVHLARKVTLTVYIALSQIGPIVLAQMVPASAAAAADKGVEDEDKAMRDGLLRLEGLTRQLDADAARLIDMELTPFKGDEDMAGKMRAKMRDWLINNTIRSDPMVKDALGQSFRKRRVDAPVGAKGNR